MVDFFFRRRMYSAMYAGPVSNMNQKIGLPKYNTSGLLAITEYGVSNNLNTSPEISDMIISEKKAVPIKGLPVSPSLYIDKTPCITPDSQKKLRKLARKISDS